MIAVLLSTYNGAAWLPEFLGSLQVQSARDWVLLVRDDGSCDESVEIVRSAARRDGRIVPHDDDLPRQGVTRSFALLLERALKLGAQHFAFADQDDVWRQHKLQCQQAALMALEDMLGSQAPVLVHTDLQVVDAGLNPIHPSHTVYARIRRDCPPDELLNTVLAHNVVTGCAAMFNRSLAELAVPFPPQAVLHDWWLALCAAAVGHIAYIPRAAVLYRQHGTNAVGARRGRWRRLDRTHGHTARRNLANSALQAQALAARLRERAHADHAVPTILRYVQLFGRAAGPVRRFLDAWRLRLGRPSWPERAALAALIATTHVEGLANQPGIARDPSASSA
jgi:glycosyltransferase involved in cell wall biosynthesis